MVEIIIWAIVIIVIGFVLLAFPNLVYELTQSWKSASPSEPSGLYIMSARIGGGVCIALGVICLIWGIVVINKENSYWDVTYKSNEVTENNYWIFDTEGNLDWTTYGTYSFDERAGENIICIMPEESENDPSANSYVMNVAHATDKTLQLIPQVFYYEPELLESMGEGETWTLADVTAEYKALSGTLNNDRRPADARYQLVRDGKELPLYYYFHSDGTYKMVQRMDYRVKHGNVIQIGKEKYSYYIDPITAQLTIYMEDRELVFEKELEVFDMDDFWEGVTTQ